MEEELVVRGRRRGGGGGGGRGRLRGLLPGDDVRQLDQGVRVDVVILLKEDGYLLDLWVPALEKNLRPKYNLATPILAQ